MKKTLQNISKKETFYILIAFFLPILYYWTVFFGKSFGYDCAPSVMGNYPPYGQTPMTPNSYCITLLDPGAYIWAHVPNWVSAIRQYLSGLFPIWDQNIGTGLPLAADFITSAYFIPLIPFALLFKLTQGNFFYLDIFFLFRYMLMSLGMYLFLRSCKLDRFICLIGSLAFFSSGYFIYLPAMNHHNVDLVLPFIGWSINNFYFTKKIKWSGISTLLLGLSMLGGMPESSIFILFFSFIYVCFLSLFYINKKKVLFLVVGGVIILGGLLLSAVLYFHGLELVFNGLSSHHGAGVQKWIEWKNIIIFILPELIGGIGYFILSYQDKLDFLVRGWNHIGFTISYLFLMSLIFIFNIWKGNKKDPLIKFFIFFLGLTIILLFQNYGIVHFFVFEQFPVFYQTQFTKYSSTLINFSLITSTMLFLHYFIKKRTRVVLIYYFFFIALLFFINYHYWNIIKDNVFYHPKFGLAPNILYAVILITFLTFCLLVIKRTKIILIIVLIILFVEFYIYLPKDGDQKRRDSLRKPPAISYLQSINDHSFRILGIDNILVPNLATVYDLSDIRILEPLWIDRYFYFIKNFYAEPDAFRITGIKEQQATQSADIVNNNFFSLLSVKYLLSYNNIETALNDNLNLKEILRQNPKKQYVGEATFDINRLSRSVLFEHAPNDIKAVLVKPRGASYLYIYPATAQGSFGNQKGNGVKLTAKIFINKRLIDSQERMINAGFKSGDQKWFEMKFGPFPDKNNSYKFTIQLITDPLGNNAFDWSGWGGFEWDSEINRTIDKYKLIYDKEMKIYENQDFLPRLRFISKTMCAKDEANKEKNFENIINLMKQNKDNIKQTAIIESKNCQAMKYHPELTKLSQTIFNDQKISFTYSSPKDQYGFLSDTYYPGWEIYINEKKGKIDPANLTFRGFKLPKGENMQVVIKYEPWTFKIGLIITILTLIPAVYISLSKNKIN
ncbi:hypothetical protein A3C23_01680 [Candidatus Roizmanbacteria bacterium RIFCSPHIGHO2_02_FULL_37_13b]|uniref:Bacterial membrane protein YfhO n=1 Tax=Candidatus Roizmanbacteria bacterium RIFCSPLOWO2_02_FULL_36_11 TaxID=1802071 RepID=A0A1F7JCX3_9BACT|nr:MAG: hypothetical protein A3C23_01680 [Candidatus Roizmanbacteria bacterium RIFCSPHIGHO2_02_FULL_37_13b]OGK53447.1 MAG: hypothetical protein A3H78_02840 [Candidatus Roizmanbacteria bacterium RIFCSPLOWO2_02_FULL_36_11]